MGLRRPCPGKREGSRLLSVVTSGIVVAMALVVLVALTITVTARTLQNVALRLNQFSTLSCGDLPLTP